MQRLGAQELTEPDDYEVFLETWEPSEFLNYANIPSNLNDPLISRRLLDNQSDETGVERTAFAPGPKIVSPEEFAARRFEYFHDNQAKWSEEFRDYVVSKGVHEGDLNTFIESFRDDWIDGQRRRQKSVGIMAIKSSIGQFDQFHFGNRVKSFVHNQVDTSVEPLFDVNEMGIIFEANEGLLEVFLSNYVDQLGTEGPSTFSEIYVRRGVLMPSVEKYRKELNYLSSYSLALTPVEQFAQLWTNKTKSAGVPSIFSAPIPAVQKRTVAFAPFISGMALEQMELIVAPPSEYTALDNRGEHGGIIEFEFK